MSQKLSIRLNRIQNHPSYNLKPIEDQTSVFQAKLFKKILDPILVRPKAIGNFRIVIIIYLYPKY